MMLLIVGGTAQDQTARAGRGKMAVRSALSTC